MAIGDINTKINGGAAYGAPATSYGANNGSPVIGGNSMWVLLAVSFIALAYIVKK